MRRPWKIALFVLLMLVTIAVIGWVQLDAIAQNWLEKTASQALGVDVKIGQFDLRRFEGELRLRDLSIANPKGFTNPHFLEIKRLDVTVQPGSLFSKKIEIPKFQSDDWKINVEQKLAENNLQKMIKSPPSTPASANPDRGQGKSVHLQVIDVNRIAVNFDLDLSSIGLPIPFLNQRQQWQHTIPSLHLENLNLGIENSQDLIRTLFSSTVLDALKDLNTNPTRSLFDQLLNGDLPFKLPSDGPSSDQDQESSSDQDEESSPDQDQNQHQDLGSEMQQI